MIAIADVIRKILLYACRKPFVKSILSFYDRQSHYASFSNDSDLTALSCEGHFHISFVCLFLQVLS